MKHRRWLLFLVAAVLVLAGGGVSHWVFQSQKEDLLQTASHDLRDASVAFVQALDAVFEPALTLGGTVKDSGIRNVIEAEQAHLFFAVATGPVRRFTQINGAFLGFPDGRFLHVQDLALQGTNVGAMFERPTGMILRRTIDNPEESRVGRWEVFDHRTGRVFASSRKSDPYDPRARPWYGAAVEAGGPIWTEAYLFASSGKLGVTYAQPIYDAYGGLWAVLGVDLSLGSLSQTLLTTSKALSGAADIVFATDFADKILGHPDFVGNDRELEENTAEFLARYRDPTSLESIASSQLKEGPAVQTVEAQGHSFLTAKADLNPDRAMPMQIYLARDMETILASAIQGMYRNVILVFASFVIFGIVATYAVKLRVEATLRQKAEADLIEARDTAEAATQAKSIFLATMSHEIRTPMNGVMSMAELLGLTRLDGEQRRMSKVITDSAHALLTIINDILDFSKIEAGKLDIERVEFSLMDVLNGSAELLAPRAEDKGLDLIVDIDPDLIDGRQGDPTRIRQILLNLGSNAVKFTESGGIGMRVRAVGPSGMRLRFEVTDTGIGLTEEQRGKLFQAFVQADTSTSRKYGGTGLGLSICQKLAELMGGDIGADSVIGQGSTFWFELPLDPIGETPPRYIDDLSAATVTLVGLSDPVADISQTYLRATGVDAVARVPDLATAEGESSLWVVACAVPDLDGEALDRLVGRIVFLGRRAEVAELAPAFKARASALLTLPVSRPGLWRAVAIGLGLQPADEVALEFRADMAFAPPGIEEARAAGALILVAEDNETNQVVVRQMLGRMGFACEIADNGRIALEMLAVPGYGLLLTDFNMPEMDGFELARAIREGEDDGGERLPIIALTADALSGTEEACMEAGMDGFLTKPIDSRKLSAELVRHLPQALDLRQPILEEETEAESGKPANDWDPDIFDPEVLGGPFGGIDAEAKELIASAAAVWVTRVEDINAALAAGDAKKARDVAHALKGATLSVGANRLGQIASDVQDFLDGGDLDTAGMMAEVLQPTLEEFQATLPKIMML